MENQFNDNKRLLAKSRGTSIPPKKTNTPAPKVEVGKVLVSIPKSNDQKGFTAKYKYVKKGDGRYRIEKMWDFNSSATKPYCKILEDTSLPQKEKEAMEKLILDSVKRGHKYWSKAYPKRKWSRAVEDYQEMFHSIAKQMRSKYSKEEWKSRNKFRPIFWRANIK